MARTTDLKARDIPYHMTACLVYKLRVYMKELLRSRLGIGQQAVSNCIGHHLLSLGFYSSFCFLFIMATVVVVEVIIMMMIIMFYLI